MSQLGPATDKHSLRLRRGIAAVVVGSVLAAALLAGCGGEDGGSADGDVTTTNSAPPGSSAPLPDLPVNKDLSAVQCTGNPQGVFDATAVVGDPIGSARRAAREKGCEIRVAVRDGKSLALTEDFRPDRINVAIESGRITEILNIA